ncbi:MAG: deoxyribodipyrimidine photo-lyase [Alphaproteobacteria bacterium]
MTQPSILWFRNDLRLSDNPALTAAVERGAPVLCLYIDDTKHPGDLATGAASRWWLHYSLRHLQEKLKIHKTTLVLRRGDPIKIIRDLVKTHDVSHVFWNRLYEPWTIKRDTDLKSALKDDGVEVETFAGSLLREPWEIETKTGGPYGVFTPFWKTLSAMEPPARPLQAPKSIPTGKSNLETDSLKDWALTPEKPDWAAGFADHWQPGEDGAQARLQSFVENGLDQYRDHRNTPAEEDGTSRLSPHLHFGEITARQVWHAIQHAVDADKVNSGSAWAYLREIGWRDFNHHLLFHNPDIPMENYKENFDAFPWRDDEQAFEAWTIGRTGYPFVDAGMRQLWKSGFMHNRVRMVTASFLVKHLLIDWRRGEAWFRDTLVDADLANNVNGWQWVAGSGADAAPYFRIFNPITQGEKFDPTGAYIRQWVPELADLPDDDLFRPWEASEESLEKAGIELDKTYPKPIIDHSAARQRALAAMQETKSDR